LLGIKGEHLGKSLSKISKAEEKFTDLADKEGMAEAYLIKGLL